MAKKITFLLVTIIIIMFLTGCTKTKPKDSAAPPPSIPSDIAKTATEVLDAYMAQDWSALYDLIHVDIQTTVEKADFIKLRDETQSHIKIKYEGFALKDSKMIKTWRNPANQELVFENVAEVSYVVTVKTPKGEKEIQNILYLAKGPDNKWKYLWVQN